MNAPFPRDERYRHRPPTAHEMDVDRLTAGLLAVIDQAVVASLTPEQRSDDQAIAAARATVTVAALGGRVTASPVAAGTPRVARRRGPIRDPRVRQQLRSAADAGQRLKALNQRRADADPSSMFAQAWTAFSESPLATRAACRHQLELAQRAGLIRRAP